MRKSNFGNVENVNAIAVIFASCKLVKEEYEEVKQSAYGFEFWDGWDLINGLYISPSIEQINQEFNARLLEADKEFQERKDVADKTYLKIDFYLDIHNNPVYYGISVKFEKGQKPIVDYNNRGLIDPNIDQDTIDKIAKYMVANSLTTEE